MKKSITVIAIAAAAILAGCSSVNKNQVGHATTLHGGFGKIGIPLGSMGALGVMGGVGYMQEEDFINPTGSNVTAAPLGFVVHSRNKQTVNGVSSGTSTNGTSGIVVEGSDDSQTIFGGQVEINDATTNRSIGVNSK